MKRLFVGLTLLLMAFFATLEHVDAVHRIGYRVGAQRWMTELILALAVVAAFAHFSDLHRRLLFPRRGGRLLLAGIVVYALAVAQALDVVESMIGMVPPEAGNAVAGLPALAARVPPLALFVLAQVLLLVGAFRALTNLVPPEEFAEDF
jgi:hypothetical protein